jgi:hypothetical protein
VLTHVSMILHIQIEGENFFRSNVAAGSKNI